MSRTLHESAGLRAGCAVCDITPPVGVELSGYAFGASEAVLHPLGAHALFLDDGSASLLLVSADVIGFDTWYADEIRQGIADAAELPIDSVMLAGTHTHSGPATATYRNWGTPDEAYRERLKQDLAELARQAVGRAFPARLGSGLAFVPGLAVNRNFEGGPTDPEADILRIDDRDGNLRAAVVTYGCHPVNLHHHESGGRKNLITPDFPHFVRQRLCSETCDGLTVLYFSSPFGDLNPANFDWDDPTLEQARATGESIANGVLAGLGGIETTADVTLRKATAEVALPLAPLPAASELAAHGREWETRLAELESDEEADPPALARARTEVEWAREALDLLESGDTAAERTIALQAFGLGDAAVLALPAEVYVDVGLKIRDVSPYYRTFMATQANGTVGYIPVDQAFDDGAYEAGFAARVYGTRAFRKGVADALAAGARQVLRELRQDRLAALATRNERSRALRERALELVRGGCQAHKAPQNLDYGAPAFVARAEGAHFWDVDGNEYIDYLMSYGPIVLGHGYPAVDRAVAEQMRKGTVFDVEFPEMVELSEKLVELIPCAEKVAYFIGGSGATTGSVALARAHTGRDKVIRSGYHGWHPWTQTGAPGTPAAYGELTLSLAYNDPDALEALLRENEGEVACIIIEAVQREAPQEGYFAAVRKLADAHGAVFVLDEVKTGFRFALGGAQEYFGIEPDLACFGKAMCNGYPGSAVVGKREIMDASVWLAATFHADAISTAAALATIRELEARDGIGHQWRLGQRLIDGLDEIFDEAGVGLKATGFPCLGAPAASHPMYQRLLGRFLTCLIAEGVYLSAHPWFLCLSHTDADIDASLDKARTALKKAMS